MTEPTILDFLRLWEFLPSIERKEKGKCFASGSERRRWIEQGSLWIDGERATLKSRFPFSDQSVILHPKSEKFRTTLQ